MECPYASNLRTGEGSHGRLYFGNRFTTVKDRRKEIGQGLLNAMQQQLGLSSAEIYRPKEGAQPE